jgi:glutamine amidotransferase-like uncharacterized protein
MDQSPSNEPVYSSVLFPRIGARCRALIAAWLVLVSTAFTACEGHGDRGSAPQTTGRIAPILLFSGTGTSPNDVAALETILSSNTLGYSKVSSSQLNEMGESQLGRYRLLIIPGGDFVEIGKSLTSNTTANIRNAVHNGLNYLGICAGGFLAGNFGSGYNSFNLTSGVKFSFYSAEGLGISKAAVAISSAAAPPLDQYWEDGPQFSGWGDVVGKYPDGTPAIVEGTFGSGWVILSGVHAEAPESWRLGMKFSSPVSEDNAYAGALVRAGLNRISLPHY